MDVALDGAHGEWLASGQGYDAIVMDIMLPGVNGYQLCARFRERGNWTPILMLTAKDGGYDEVEALDTGSDDFLSKPFSYVVLVARLRALLRRGAVERTPALRRGNLSVDPAPRRCARGAVEIDMKAKGLSVTEYLMRRAGEVVTKSDILEHLWDFGFDGDPNVVEVHVSALRRKTDKPFATQSIQTARGAGYKLVGASG